MPLKIVTWSLYLNTRGLSSCLYNFIEAYIWTQEVCLHASITLTIIAYIWTREVCLHASITLTIEAYIWTQEVCLHASITFYWSQYLIIILRGLSPCLYCNFESYIWSQEVCLHASITLEPFRGALSPVNPICEQSLACWSTVNSCRLGLSRGTATWKYIFMKVRVCNHAF